MKYYFFLRKWRKSSEWKIGVTVCAFQSNSYLSIESAKRKIWKWWSAFRQETRKLGEVKRGSWQTCAMLIASVIAKMIALFPRMGRTGWRHCCCLSYMRKKNLHFPSAGTDWVAPSMIYLEKGKQFSKGSPENVVRQTKLKPGWNQMSNLISDISLRYILLGRELLWVWWLSHWAFSSISNDSTVIPRLWIELMLIHCLAVKECRWSMSSYSHFLLWVYPMVTVHTWVSNKQVDSAFLT